MLRSMTRRLALLATAHFAIDSYSSFYLPLLPLLMQRLGLNYTMVGGLVALGSMSSSFSQPLFGLISDRLGRPWFVALGPHGGGHLPLGHRRGALVRRAGHAARAGRSRRRRVPPADRLARRQQRAAARPRDVDLDHRRNARLGAGAPVRDDGRTRAGTGAHVDGGCPRRRALAGACLAWLRREPSLPHAERARTRPSDLRPVARPLGLLYLVVVVRSAVSSGFATFLPLYVHERGWSVEAGGALTTVYLTAGALGGFAGGWLSDRLGGLRVVRGSFALAAPFYAAFFLLPERWGLLCLVAGYAILQATLPVNVVLGQELSPRHSSAISSLLMGAAWGVGALLVGPVGALADRAGLRVGLMALSSLIVPGFLCALALPAHRFAAPHAAPADASRVGGEHG